MSYASAAKKALASSFDVSFREIIEKSREEILDSSISNVLPKGTIHKSIVLGGRVSRASSEVSQDDLHESIHFPPLPATAPLPATSPRRFDTSTPLSSPTASPPSSPNLSPIKKAVKKVTKVKRVKKNADPKKAKQINRKKRTQTLRRDEELENYERKKARIEEEKKRAEEERKRLAAEEEELAKEGIRIAARLKYGAGPKRVKKTKKVQKKVAEQPVEKVVELPTKRVAELPAKKTTRKRKAPDADQVVKKPKISYEAFEKKDHFPTPEEMAYLEAYTKMSTQPKFKKESPIYQAMNPIRICFTGLDDHTDPKDLEPHVAKIFDIFLRRMIELVGGDLKTTKYWVKLDHKGTHENRGYHIRHKSYEVADGLTLLNKLSDHMQSNKEIKIDDSLRLTMYAFQDNNISGKGRVTVRIQNELMETYFGVKNNRVVGDSHCLPKALALGQLKFEQTIVTSNSERNNLCRKMYNMVGRGTVQNRERLQLIEAQKLLAAAGMDVDQKAHGREDLEQLAAHLSDYQIHLWDASVAVPTEQEIFNPGAKKFIGLMYHDKHYEFVTHVKLPREARFCNKCFKFGDNNHWKKCSAKCWLCGRVDCVAGADEILCTECNYTFTSQKCYDAHKKKTASPHSLSHCEKYFYCPTCGSSNKTLKYGKQIHECFRNTFCNVCRKKVGKDHDCMHAVPDAKMKERLREKQKNWKVIVYDMECVVASSGTFDGDDERGPNHKPNLICVRMFCNECRGAQGCTLCGDPWCYSYTDVIDGMPTMPVDDDMVDSISSESSSSESEDSDKDSDEDSDEDSNEEKDTPSPSLNRTPEKRYTPEARFAEFLMKDSRANGAYVIAHNGGRYDHALLLAEMDRQGGAAALSPSIILKGNTIISAEYKYKKQKLHFRDSLQYLVMALSKMPEAFGLSGEAKGFFPHLYNHPDNYGKVLATLPPQEYYSPDFMKPEVRSEFERWYAESYNNGFVLHDELLKYCQSDVRILTLTLIAFIEKCEQMFNGWNPLINGTTLASFVFHVLKHEYIKEGDVGFVPENGFGGGTNSKLAYKYLQWIEKQNPGLKLEYALRGGERDIRSNGHNYYVDGFDGNTNTIYEVHGCLWHGCKKCYPLRDQQLKVLGYSTPQLKYDETEQRENHLRSDGYTLHSVWECEIREMLERDPKMRRFFEMNNYTQRLAPREALFGGRTQAYQSLAEASSSEQLEYYDFNSMYPYLNAGGTEYPRGNPIVITHGVPKPDQPLTKRGLVYCDVLPPVSAPMGLLPSRIQSKLMFPLCRTCAEDQLIDKECPHRLVSERLLTGVWTTDELNKAISAGYKVLKYHEIWHWKEWVKGGFFADYIKPLLKVKHESSGWPRDDMTEDEKKAHVKLILDKDGVQLDAANIKKNKAMRSLSKIFLNSAWGKFAQNPDKVETILVRKADYVKMSNFFNDPLFEPTGLMPFGEEKVWISRKPRQESMRTIPFASLAIGAITTSAARLKLTEAIERVGVENMLYCDTDSIIFRQKAGADPLKDLKGRQLGALVDEIPQGSKLDGVVAMAPKVYALRIRKDDGTFTYSVKVKGMTLNSVNAQKITFDTMKDRMEAFIRNEPVEPLEGQMIRFNRGKHALSEIWTGVMTKQLTPRMDKGHYANGVSVPFGILPKGTIIINDYPF